MWQIISESWQEGDRISAVLFVLTLLCASAAAALLVALGVMEVAR